jgi:hypothetical protein
MADLKYVFEVDDKDILTTIKNHEILEKRVTSLKKEYTKLDLATNSGKAGLLDYAKATQQLDQQIAHLEATLKKGGKSVNQLASGMNISGKSTRNMELQFQQAGYQIQDFIVQVQGGVNPLIAFSQQGSQLAGFFAGPWGAAIGLGIAALSSLAMVMLSSADETNKTKEALDEFEGKIKSITQTLKEWTLAKEAAAAGVTVEQYLGIENIDEAVKKVEAAREALIKANEAAQASSYTAGGFGGGGEAALTNFLISLMKIKGATEEQKTAIENLTAAEKILADLRKKEAEDIGQAYLDAINLGKADVSSGIDKAAEAAKLLAERMGISLGAAQAMVNVASLADKGGQAFINSPGYDPLNTRVGATGNQDVRGQMSGYSWRQSDWNATHPTAKNAGIGGGGAGMGGQTQEEYIAKLTREYEMKKKSLELTDEQVKRTEFLFSLDERLSTMKTKRSELEIETEKQRAIAAYDAYAAAEKHSNTMDMISSNMNDAFMSMVDGSQTVSGAFRNMMYNILKSVAEQNIIKPATDALSGLFSGMLGGIGGGGGGLFGGSSWSANGNIVGSSGIQAFAKGGVVGSPTMFKHGGGLGVMGEAGPEAIMPLKRGSNGKLGVQVDGGNSGNGGNITVNNNINVVGSDAAMVRAEVTKMIPQITEASKVAVIDAKRRGGQMGAAFR